MTDDQRVLAAGSPANSLRDTGLFRAGDEMVDEHTEPPSRAWAELVTDRRAA